MKNNLYVWGLMGAMTLSGCQREEPGIYKGTIEGWNAVYDARVSYACTLTLEKEDKRLFIEDSLCDGMDSTLDYVESSVGDKKEYYYSTDLQFSGRIGKLNSLLREGQKLVKPENRDLEREEQIRKKYQGYGKEAQEELDDLLKP